MSPLASGLNDEKEIRAAKAVERCNNSCGEAELRAEPPASGAEHTDHVPESKAVWSIATKIETTSSWQPTKLEKNSARSASDHTRGYVRLP
jgi:hypothetical protein